MLSNSMISYWFVIEKSYVWSQGIPIETTNKT